MACGYGVDMFHAPVPEHRGDKMLPLFLLSVDETCQTSRKIGKAEQVTHGPVCLGIFNPNCSCSLNANTWRVSRMFQGSNFYELSVHCFRTTFSEVVLLHVAFPPLEDKVEQKAKSGLTGYIKGIFGFKS